MTRAQLQAGAKRARILSDASEQHARNPALTPDAAGRCDLTSMLTFALSEIMAAMAEATEETDGSERRADVP